LFEELLTPKKVPPRKIYHLTLKKRGKFLPFSGKRGAVVCLRRGGTNIPSKKGRKGEGDIFIPISSRIKGGKSSISYHLMSNVTEGYFLLKAIEIPLQ